MWESGPLSAFSFLITVSARDMFTYIGPKSLQTTRGRDLVHFIGPAGI
jgi:hypothetical protein